jgi:hypothetical protein
MDHGAVSGVGDKPVARKSVNHVNGFLGANIVAYPAALAKSGVYFKIFDGIKAAYCFTFAAPDAFMFIYAGLLTSPELT